MAMTLPRTRAGYVKVRPVGAGSRVAVVAPASPFDRAEFDRGLAELKRLGFEPCFDERVFARRGFRAGDPELRAAALREAFARPDVDAIVAVRGGYGSVETLPFLDADAVRRSRTAFIGYSDVTSIHSFVGVAAGLVTIHGPMIEGRLAAGPEAYDADSFTRVLAGQMLGELRCDGLDALHRGDARGPLVGGTLTQLLASFGTPYEFRPPPAHVLFLDEVGERPYRLHRMLTQWRLSGRLRNAVGIVFGQLPRCDEAGGVPTAREAIADALDGFPGPVLVGFPSGHTTSPLVTLPFGVEARVVGHGDAPCLVIEESAAE
jgi:muramoyltetrapeptide carboxypeptidase